MATTGETLITGIDDISGAKKTMQALLVNGSALGRETLADIFYVMCPATAAAHNAMPPRGKNITGYVTDGTLWNRIAGTGGYEEFEDIFLGDYIDMTASVTAPGSTVTGTNRIRVGGFNLHWNNNQGMRYNSLTMIPDTHFGNGVMNDTNTTVGGYAGSKMNNDTIGAVASTGNASGTINEQLYAIFASHLKTSSELLTNAMTSTLYNRLGSATGASSGWAWTNCQAVLLSEVETYGSTTWSSSGYDTGTAKEQLPLFAKSVQKMIPDGVYWWLKDVASGALFCLCGDNGCAYYDVASNRRYVRPRFIIA